MSGDLVASTLTWALAYTGPSLRWRVIPIAPGKKYPAGFNEWQKQATTDEATVRGWWGRDYDAYGIGVATGAASGIFVIDVDGDAGRSVMATWQMQHGPFPDTVEAISGSGDGRHYVFQYPGYKVRTRRGTDTDPIVPKGIDVRGDGGQFVVAPTQHPNGGHYAWVRPPFEFTPAVAPAWLLDIVRDDQTHPNEAPQSTGIPLHTPRPDTDDGLSPVEWFNSTHDLRSMLQRDGWIEIGGGSGTESRWVRPGKDPRRGHSAVLHEDANPVLVIFSSEAPAELLTLDTQTRVGDAWRLDAYEYEAATRWRGDKKAMARDIAGNRAPRSPRIDANASGGTTGAEDSVPPPPMPVLGDDFWNARETLAHIRDAAYAQRRSPDATLAVVVTRRATVIHPSIVLPAIVGSVGSLNLFTALVAHSGGGKSTTYRLGADVYPVPESPREWMFDVPLGSGEGIAEAYIGEEEVETEGGKKVKRRVKVRNAVMFHADEGESMVKLGERSGSLLGPELRKAFSGGTLGQSNASRDTHRVIPAHTYRCTLTVGFQYANAATMLATADVGTPQRFLWAPVTHPGIPLDAGDWPGPVAMPSLPSYNARQHTRIEFPASVARDIVVREHAAITGAIVVNALESQHTILRMKLAALLGFCERREPIVTVEDWQLAGAWLDSSDAVRRTIEAYEVERRESEAFRKRDAQARTAVHVRASIDQYDDTENHRRMIEWATKMSRKVHDGSLSTVPDARRAARNYRNQFDDALDHAKNQGWILEVDQPGQGTSMKVLQAGPIAPP